MKIAALFRYPVKSLQGERLEAATIGALGIEGDRQWAILDTDTGKTLTARRVPELLLAYARRLGPADVEVEFPDGRVMTEPDELSAALSAWLGRPVAFVRAGPDRHGTYETVVDFEDEAGSEWTAWDGPVGTFHDSARTQVSMMSTATIGAWDLRRFRPNVLLAGAGEDALVGHAVALGGPDGTGPGGTGPGGSGASRGAVLDVVKQIGRCVVTTRPQPGGIDRDLDVLRTVNRARDGFLGIGALVRTPGAVAVGDELRVL